jgi:YegS/Rv2252/BmrU family lipid kinase
VRVGTNSAIAFVINSQRLFIINPAAGAGRTLPVWSALQPELRRRALHGDHFVTNRPGEALDVAAAAAGKYKVVVAVGGDGTVFETVSGLLRSAVSGTTLGIIPCGTGNDAAQNLGITSVAAGLRAIESGSPLAADTIAITCRCRNQVIQHHALLFAAAGIIGPQLRYTTALTKRILGRALAYRFATIRALLAYRPLELTVSCDGRVFKEPFLYVGAHNAETIGGGMRIAPGAKLDDGLMRLNLIASVGRCEALRQLRRLCRGEHTGHPGVRYLTGTNLEIQSTEPIDIAADGDLIGFTPARFSVRPRSLLVLQSA